MFGMRSRCMSLVILTFSSSCYPSERRDHLQQFLDAMYSKKYALFQLHNTPSVTESF